jgi:glycosyltransferase involved in cell wall biosynthesis
MADTRPAIWMDLTTSLRARGGQNNGTLRVERSFARELQPLLGDRLRFCRYDATRQRFDSVDASALADAIKTSAPAAHRGPGASNARADRLGRRIERAVRLSVRGTIQRLHGALRGSDPAAHFPDAQPGDVLLLAGENWSGRTDFGVLARLRTERGLTIAAVCQDLIPVTHPQFFETGEFVAQYRRYVEFLARHTDLVIAISQATANELAKAAEANGGMRGKIAVVELGSDVASAADPQPPQTEPPLQAGAFVISVSTIQARKNFDLLYRLWHRFAQEGRGDVPRLVIVGQRGFGSDDLLATIAQDATIRNRLTILHRTSDAELTWLYQNCAYTLYPSYVEGWGLPVSESLAYGKLCLASNTSSLPEAGAGLALHFGPDDDAAWHAAIVDLAANPAKLAEAEARIRASYRQRNWQQAGAELTGHLNTLLARKQ